MLDILKISIGPILFGVILILGIRVTRKWWHRTIAESLFQEAVDREDISQSEKDKFINNYIRQKDKEASKRAIYGIVIAFIVAVLIVSLKMNY